MKTDCLLIGFNDSSFEAYVNMVKAMGRDSGAYRDLNLAFVTYEGKPLRSMDLLNHFYSQDKGEGHRPFHNTDFLWPTVTYLGTYLNRRGFTFDFINLFHLEKERLKEKLLSGEVLTVGITTTLYVSPHPILEIISFIRQYSDSVKIIVGGPYVSNQAKMAEPEMVQELFRYLGADFYVISQEGELALTRLLAALKDGSELGQVDNIAYRHNNSYVFTGTSIEKNSLEENMVDYSLFPRHEIGGFVSLRTAKSCPFACSFCGFPQRAGKYTYTEVGMVEQELNALYELGSVTTLTFLDDTFNVPKKRFKEILRMMIKNKYGFKWNSFLRSDHSDEEAIELMGEAGCEGVFLGVESGSDEMLTRMNKTSRRANYLSAIPMLRRAGISTHANFIVGFPGETLKTYEETISLIEKAKPDFYRAQLWYCDPVTPIWNQRDEYGVKGSAFNWSHNTMDFHMACDLVDQLFLCIQNSVWLPQNGFEQWSTFYLQRKGMSLEQIKTFLRFFNSSVKEKLIHGDDAPISPVVLDGLEKSCKFERGERADEGVLEIYSGERYVAARDYWLREFGGASPAGIPNAAGEGLSALDAERGVVCFSAPLVLDTRSLAVTCEASEPSVYLAAYATLLSRLSGSEEAVVVAALRDPETDSLLPLRLRPLGEVSFRELVKNVERKIGQAIEHELYGLSIVTNPWRMAQVGAECPALDAGFVCSTGDGQGAGQSHWEATPLSREVWNRLGLILEVDCTSGLSNARFTYRRGGLSQKAVKELSELFQRILREVVEGPETRLEDITVAGEERNLGLRLQDNARQEFHF